MTANRILQLVSTAALVGTALAVPAGVRAQDPEAAGGKNYALLVGCADYDPKELRPLPYAQHDVLALYEGLLEAGFAPDNIVLLHDRQTKNYLPEVKKIRTQLDLLLTRLSRNDALVVALAGHGVQFRGDKASYFCPVDAELNDRHTLISLDELYGQLKGCRARRKLLLVDACRNHPQSALARSRATVDLETVTRPQVDDVPEGTVALFSCAAGQESFESPELQHGIFFYHVLKGWQGAADANRDGKLTLDELVDYVKDRTQTFAHLKLGAKQNPFQRGEFTGVWVLRQFRAAPPKPQPEARRPDPDPAPAAGRHVEVEWHGSWWPAVVLQTQGNRSLIHYTGWDSSWDEWVGRDRLRLVGSGEPPELLVNWQGSWWPAVILASEKGWYKVHYTGWDASWDEWVGRDRLYYARPRPDEVRAQVEWGGSWWSAVLLRQQGAKYLVHYPGWDASWDEWVTAERVRRP
jgi:hypothetical protein